MALPSPEAFASRTRVIAVFDLAGYAQAFRVRTDLEMAHFLDRYYREAENSIDQAGGRVVKFIGDSVLAVWEPEDASRAVAAVVALQRVVEALGREMGVPVQAGANVHSGSVVQGDFGHGPSRRADVIGRAVNQTFLQGRGPGIRISEPVYRRLPSAERGPWSKNKPPAVYTFSGTERT